jgi:hypothetical protein
MKPMGQTLYIDGVDAQERMVNFAASPVTSASYSVSVYTRPPTHRADDLEKSIVAFVADTLKCGVRQVARNENGPERRTYYDEYFKKVETRVREAKGDL